MQRLCDAAESNLDDVRRQHQVNASPAAFMFTLPPISVTKTRPPWRDRLRKRVVSCSGHVE